MRVYRLSKEKYKDDLSDRGAENFGGRWNSRGTRMVYTSDSRALAKLEVAVNVALHRIPKNYFMTIIEIPDVAVADYNSKLLEGKNWKNNPPIKFTQSEGDNFVKSGSDLALKVPSVVVEGDYNYIINPSHPNIGLVKIVATEKFSFDMRLFK